MLLSDPDLDVMSSNVRQEMLLAAVRSQLAFVSGAVPFWREHLARALVDADAIRTIEDLARIPILSKAEFRDIHPTALVPAQHLKDVHVTRWTSGRSGRATVCFWTQD